MISDVKLILQMITPLQSPTVATLLIPRNLSYALIVQYVASNLFSNQLLPFCLIQLVELRWSSYQQNGDTHSAIGSGSFAVAFSFLLLHRSACMYFPSITMRSQKWTWKSSSTPWLSSLMRPPPRPLRERGMIKGWFVVWRCFFFDTEKGIDWIESRKWLAIQRWTESEDWT